MSIESLQEASRAANLVSVEASRRTNNLRHAIAIAIKGGEGSYEDVDALALLCSFLPTATRESDVASAEAQRLRLECHERYLAETRTAQEAK